MPYEIVLKPATTHAFYVYKLCFAGPLKFKNYNTNKPRVCLHQIGEIVEQDALMPPNLCEKLEDSVDVYVCCLVVFNLLIHFLK